MRDILSGCWFKDSNACIIVSIKSIKKTVRDLLSHGGISLQGENPWDIQVFNEDFYPRILAGGSLALGESYMDGWWESSAIDELINRLIRSNLHKKVTATPQMFWKLVKARIINRQSVSRAFEIGKHHYDIGNELFKNMLDKRLNYSCAYWKNARNLDEAQEAKLDLICRKLKLGKGMRVLDIGCGWGSFALYAAEKYDEKVVGITVSEKQVNLARELCKGKDIDIRLMDYRNMDEKFDRVVSIGMFEHVGYKNHNSFFRVVRRCLNEEGLFLLHTIGGNQSVVHTDPWIHKYIFPDSLIPSVFQIIQASKDVFLLEDWHNFGTYYDRTILSWYANFNKNWPKIKATYNERFYRMWKYYLLSCAGSFRSHHNQLWQVVFSLPGSPGIYESVR